MKRVALLAVVLCGCSVSSADTPSDTCRKFERAAQAARRPTSQPVESTGVAAGLMRSADEALDRGDLRTYHRLLSDAVTERVTAEIEGRTVNATLDAVRTALCSR
jgi:hypothetical protein